MKNHDLAAVPIILIIMAFFGPYYPGTPFRVDQILGLFAIITVTSLFFTFRRLRFSSSYEKNILVFSLLIAFVVFVRVIIDFGNFRDALQIINQFTYLAAGASIWYLFRNKGNSEQGAIIKTLFIVSIFINLFAVYQLLFPDSALVALGFKYFGGVGNEAYEFEDYDTLAAKSVLGGQRFTSIFSGQHSLGVFNLFLLAVCVSVFRDRRGLASKALVLSSGIMCIIGGLLSTSKVFVFGSIILLGIILILSITKRAFFRGGLFLLVFFSLFWFLASENRVLGDIFNVFVQGSFADLFKSRFGGDGEVGYLSSVMAKTFEPFTLLFGLGGYAMEYKYSDFQFRQVILVGGLPLFVLYYGVLLYMLVLNWIGRRLNPYALPFFALGVAFIIAGVGIPVHLQARTIPLWMFFNLLFAIPKPSTTDGTSPSMSVFGSATRTVSQTQH